MKDKNQIFVYEPAVFLWHLNLYLQAMSTSTVVICTCALHTLVFCATSFQHFLSLRAMPVSLSIPCVFLPFSAFLYPQRLHEPVHYNVALVENNLGLTLSALGDVSGAVEALHAAADTWASLQGPSHPQVRF